MKKKKTSSTERGKEINPDLRNAFLQRKRVPLKVGDYVRGLKEGNRMLLAQAITLVESHRPEQMQLAQEVLEQLRPLPLTSFRIGITGSPGVGKSTFIEALGMHFIEQGHKVAVLSIDPSSHITKGSILGDKTRMTELSAQENAFIRPSPSAGNLGGVARNTRETIELCEAAGYNRILIETVGVGQSEMDVYFMTDFFLLLLLPGAGDDLQGIKRGIVEMADLLVINKSDGEQEQLALHSKRDYQTALRLFPAKSDGWKPVVQNCSALNRTGIPEIIKQLDKYQEVTERISSKRARQNKYWMYEAIENALKATFFQNATIQQAIQEMEEAIDKGDISPFMAAEKLLNLFNQLK